MERHRVGVGQPLLVTGQADNGTTYTNLGKSYAQLLPAPPLATACMLSRFSPVRLSVTLWTVILQAPQSMGFFQARILEWVAISSSKKSS